MTAVPVDMPEDVFNQWIFNLTQDLRDRITRGETPQEATERLRSSEQDQWAWQPSMLHNRLCAIEHAQEKLEEELKRVRYLRQMSIRSGRPDWYAGPGANSTNWTGLENRLKELDRSDEEIKSVDEESTTIVSLLDSPGQEQFSTRGLVIGHVQSGKTGNMAAVIAKAADTPFKFFIVLSGMTDSLRNQTQSRLDADIVSTCESNRWFSWTKVDRIENGAVVEKGDFNHPAVGGFPLDGSKNHLAVIKKNAGILRRLLAKLRSTPVAVLRQTPVLIIDDECDQASVNSAALDRAISTINRLVREIIEILPRVSYVGYTATPFANVLISPANVDDLYPRHFIHPMRRPKAYFGAVELFGREALEGDKVDVETGFNMIREVPEDEAPRLRPSSRARGGFNFEVTPALANAIRYFVLTVAARECRGQESEHSSMLVHTSVLNSVHKSTERAVRPYMESLSSRLASGDSTLLRELQDLWEEECSKVSSEDFGRTSLTFDQLCPRLAVVAQSIEVKVENWSSDDRIDYSIPARRYLVIGGNVLARGLTLHGLIVSFFMRSSSQYDTLMQMGRWFGYRKGFEDLPRVWMEASVREAFFDLATVEEEIRRDAHRYADENFTPEEFAVRIRKIPGLAITARSKMRNAVTARIGYEGEHLQTIRFPRYDDAWLRDNWVASSELVDRGIAKKVRSNRIVSGIDVEDIRKFLSTYQVYETHRTMERGLLLDYISRVERDNSSLSNWNVAVISSESGNASELPLGQIGAVNCVTRSPLQESKDIASIKALMSKQDLVADMEHLPAAISSMNWEAIKRHRESHRMPPLLLLYPIDRRSEPKDARTRQTREPMNSPLDVMGLGILFPGNPDSGVEYVHADLQPEDAGETFEGEDALPEDLIDGAR